MTTTDMMTLRLLAARVKPFLMRRTKEEVAPELPERTVIDETIPLEGAQVALYQSVRTTMDRQVREAIAAQGIADCDIRGVADARWWSFPSSWKC
jgi:SNF2 family DNA or RNA helicase